MGSTDERIPGRVGAARERTVGRTDAPASVGSVALEGVSSGSAGSKVGGVAAAGASISADVPEARGGSLVVAVVTRVPLAARPAPALRGVVAVAAGLVGASIPLAAGATPAGAIGSPAVAPDVP